MFRIAAWNIQRLNFPAKQRAIRDLVLKHRISLHGIVETRVRKQKCNKVLRECRIGMSCMENYNYARNGRIWLLWNPFEVKVTDRKSVV